MGRQFASAAGIAGTTTGNFAFSTTPLCTLACYYMYTSSPATGGHTIIGVGSTTLNTYFGLGVTITTGPVVKLNAFSSNGAEVDANTGTALTVNQWYHAGATFDGTTQKAYRNGVLDASGSMNVPGTMNKINLGGLVIANSTVSRPSIPINVSHAAIWNVALTAMEMASLAAGVPPYMIRPQSLVFYWPLFGFLSPEPEWISQRTMTLTSSPPQVMDAPTALLAPTTMDTPLSFKAAWAMQANNLIGGGII